ncbi:MAG TPA: sugar transferase [Solirubrobacteraceae bacterium]|nr:sugar transferase [Solirubrobacteraceae bacterium]
MIRRAFDVAVAASVLVLTAPLLVAAAVAIKLTSRGPVLYRQARAGLHGHGFEVVKLRTMVKGAEFIGAGMAVEEDDARITRVGALLRRTSIDELPNLWNVLRGEMSVIGPRPTLPEQIEAYDERQRRRLEVKPGITGWAQVNGRAALPWSERIELDIHYVENRSLRLDATILLRTARIVFGGDRGGGVYHPGGGGFDL